MKEKIEPFYTDVSWVLYHDYTSELKDLLSIREDKFCPALNWFFIPQEILVDFYNKIKTIFSLAQRWNLDFKDLIVWLYFFSNSFKIPFEDVDKIKKQIWNIWFLDEYGNMNWYYTQLCHFCIWIDENKKKLFLKNPFFEDKIESVIDL